jgi:hypothetical protein
MRIALSGLLLAILAALGPGPAQAEDPFNEVLYRGLLSRHTRSVEDTAGTRVDYRRLRGSSDWQRLLRNVAQARPEDLRGQSERLAFWINVYNVLAIDVVLRHYPVESIKDAGRLFTPVWKIDAGTVGGRIRSLHEIEHEILRPMGEPRIHAAIVCASTSCPSLAREPYTAAQLDAQLDAALASFLADPRKGLAVDRPGGQLKLSRIFDWFEDDFAAQGGVRAFVTLHAPAKERAWLAGPGKSARIRSLDYDWSLNDLADER